MTVSLAFLGAAGSGELILLFVVVLVFFGPKRLPGIARSIGRALEQLRRASQDFHDQIMDIEEETPPVSGPPLPPPDEASTPAMVTPAGDGDGEEDGAAEKRVNHGEDDDDEIHAGG